MCHSVPDSVPLVVMIEIIVYSLVFNLVVQHTITYTEEDAKYDSHIILLFVGEHLRGRLIQWLK